MNNAVFLIQQTTGVRANLDSGGTAMVAAPSFRSFAQNGETWQTLDGIVMNRLKDGQSGGDIGYAALEEARLWAQTRPALQGNTWMMR